MKHLYKITLLLLLALLMPATALAYDFFVDGIYYNINGTDATVTNSPSSNKYSGDIVIPASVTFNSTTYSVTSIAPYAFSSCSGLTSITIPTSVTSIGNDTFHGCSSLTSITIPESVTNIGNDAFSYCTDLASISVNSNNTVYDSRDNCNAIIKKSNNELIVGCKNTVIPSSVTSICDYAFYGCSGLTSITIPSSVTNIGSCAFSYCNSLTSITIPSSVTTIGDWAFNSCSGLTSISIPSSVTSIGNGAFGGTSLTSISVNSNNTVYDSRDNCNAIIKKSNNELVVGCKNTVIPSSVATIGDHAFSSCSSLTSITIPGSVATIGDHAFSSCSSLTSITIPGSVRTIGDWAFSNCSSLTSITIPGSVATIGDHAFSDCTGLTSASILTGVTSIGKGAFYFCSSLTSITIPSSVISFGEGAFSACINLTSVTIQMGVTNIGDYAFSACSSLTSITIPESVTTIGFNAFEYCGSLTSITIPSSVTSIGAEAFYFCCGLTSITIPESVISIGDKAFYCCTGLTSITIPESVTSIGHEVFGWCPLITATIPTSVTSSIGDDDFWDLLILFITGEGEWQVGKLPWGIKTLHIGSEVTGVKGMQANPEKIYSYATTPPVCDENSFTGYDAELHVPASSMAAYFTAPYWCNFTNIIGDAVMVTGLTLEQDNIKMEVGSQLTLTATIMPVSAMNQAVTWTTTNNTIATVDNGVVTAVKPGECNIVATCGNKQAICHVIVVEHLIYITLDQHETRLLPNHLLTLTPTVTPVATDLVVTSSNPAVAAARMAENKIQVMGITEGTATIYVNSADGYAFSDSCVVTVYTERGDVNCDGFVNISDATSLIDALLDGGNVYSTENADCNNDGKVTITDLTRLIDALLGGTVLPEKDPKIVTANRTSLKMVEVSQDTVPTGETKWYGNQSHDNDLPAVP